VRAAVVPVRDHPLHPAEEAAAARFAPVRRATFASGRAAARLALESDAAIPVLAGGAPAAPAGWRLSISHTDSLAVAIAAPAAVAAGLGVDVEDVSRMDPKLRRLIVRAGDRVPEDAGAALLTATFSLREALYKAVGGRGEGLFVRWDGQAAVVGVEGHAPPLRWGWAQRDGHVLSWCVLDPLPIGEREGPMR
jgi:4'-phosphopantetheinyl transferase EntD